ncbi:hypothetical protein LSH36_530g01007 [Paralvinella palmiformis]|uniref:BTB domain-containing protein n=1 Tax=Paralvinella palmiformis TaxID=53620 RepID=A0AAD9J8E7_9ANNE|nr:hypothetical protein LSH36_530g01007 [Paralvinella palmiformis]
MHIEDLSQQERLIAGLQNLYAVGLVTDVILVAGDVEVPCHRSVLAACSPYFRAMFSSKMSESYRQKVELHNVPSGVLRPLLDYIYNSTIDIDNENVQDLFGSANMFELLELHDLCAQYMLQELTPANCMSVYRLAAMHCNEFLLAVTKGYLMKHFGEIAPTGELNGLELGEFLGIISNDDLNIKSEEVVFDTVVKWVQYDFAGRKLHLPVLMKSVRLGLLSEDYMDEVVGLCDMIMKDPFCRSMFSLARLQVAACGSVGMGDEDALEIEAPTQCGKRYGMHCTKLIIFVGAGQVKDVKGLGCYDPRTGKNYYAVAPQFSFDFRNRIDHHRVTVTKDNQILVAGGVLYENYMTPGSGEALSEMLRFDFGARSWLRLPQMIERRCAHALVAHDNYVYAIGGKSLYPQGDPLPTVECFSIEKNRWEYGADLPVALCHHHAFSYKKSIIVVGGDSTDGLVSDVIYQYFPSCNMWERYPVQLENPRTEFGATLVDDKLYICGGWNGQVCLNIMEVIDLDSKKWSRGADFHEDRKSPAMFALDEQVYLCGGIRTVMMSGKRPKEVTSRDLWRYDAKSNCWHQEVKLVPYANCYGYAIAELNIKDLQESDFLSKNVTTL